MSAVRILLTLPLSKKTFNLAGQGLSGVSTDRISNAATVTLSSGTLDLAGLAEYQGSTSTPIYQSWLVNKYKYYFCKSCFEL